MLRLYYFISQILGQSDTAFGRFTGGCFQRCSSLARRLFAFMDRAPKACFVLIRRSSPPEAWFLSSFRAEVACLFQGPERAGVPYRILSFV